MLLGQSLLYAISFDKDNLYLEFESGVLWCRFVQQELWFQWLVDVPSRNAKKKNGQVQFKELHGNRVTPRWAVPQSHNWCTKSTLSGARWG